MVKIFEGTKLFIFDLDGTLYFGDELAPKAAELIDFLRKKFQIVFYTNNSSKTGEEVWRKLNNLGISCDLNEVYSSSTATADYLIEHELDNVYVIGSQGLSDELRSKNIEVTNNESADHVVVGMDFDFNYQKISTALSILLKGGKFIVCNEDRSFPSGNQKRLPACGAMVGAISTSANKKPDFIVGKPSPYVLNKIGEQHKVSNHEVVVVGDSIESDISMALEWECKAILVDFEEKMPEVNVPVIKDLNEIFGLVKEN
jgi:HAD superfamily hydrolase (TIGR01450 family)